ncbi:hypothetical protein RQP46_001565 [Phenoliferia psychrophenolica]
MEISCHVAWTSFGWSTTVPGSYLDACPGQPGPYHADPLALQVIPTEIAGCALGIANVDNIEDTNMDNIVIFSVQPNCVQNKMTSFDIPKMMPECSGEKCICGWFWLPENGAANFFMTAFDCSVSNVSPEATGFKPLTDSTYCEDGDSTCGANLAHRPLYAYNTPTNLILPTDPSYVFNNNRPGYHATWGFQPGAQDGIFLPPKVASGPSIPIIPLPIQLNVKIVSDAGPNTVTVESPSTVAVANPKFNPPATATPTTSAPSKAPATTSAQATPTATPASTTSENPRIVAISSRIAAASSSRAQASSSASASSARAAAASARMAQISSRHASALAIQATKTGEYHARRTVALSPVA